MTHVSSFVFHSLFLCRLHVHTYANQNVLAEFEKYIILTMTMFVGFRSFISLPHFMFVGGAVSEIRESNQNKEKEKLEKKNNNNLQNGYFQFNTFPRHIIDPFFHQGYRLTISTH